VTETLEDGTSGWREATIGCKLQLGPSSHSRPANCSLDCLLCLPEYCSQLQHGRQLCHWYDTEVQLDANHASGSHVVSMKAA
jgi:hypothetical protein